MKQHWNPPRYLSLVNWALLRYVQKKANANKERKAQNLACYFRLEQSATQKYLPLPSDGGGKV